MKRIALAVTVVVAAVAAAAFAATGSAQSQRRPRCTWSRRPSSRSASRPGIGSRVRATASARATRSRDDTGVDRVSCTVIGQRQAMCTAVAQLSKGTLTAESLVSFEPGPTRYAITGGTGAYEGASGTAVVSDVPGTAKADIQITLLP